MLYKKRREEKIRLIAPGDKKRQVASEWQVYEERKGYKKR